MGAITSAVIAIAGVVLGWIAIEIACKPCLDQGRTAIDRSLNPDYDPDDDVSSNIRAPLNPTSDFQEILADPTPPVASSAPVKAVWSLNSSPLFFSGIFQTATIQFKGKEMKSFRACVCVYLMFFVSLRRWLTDMNCLTSVVVNESEIVAYMFVVLPIVWKMSRLIL